MTDSKNAWTALDRDGQMEFPSGDRGVAEIWGYTDKLSYPAGQTVHLHVHTTAPEFDVRVYRDGASQTEVFEKRGIPGTCQSTPENALEVGCGWEESLRLECGRGWEPGVYVIILRAEVGDEVVEREAFFVLRDGTGRHSRMAFILSTATYTVYNDWGGANHYRRVANGVAADEPAPILSLERPWARGFLRLPDEAPRYSDGLDAPPGALPRYPWVEWALENGFSRHYADSGWAYYDAPFVRWAERQGFTFDFLTQSDLHADPGCLSAYDVAVIVGHDEYWSWEMRDAVDGFLDWGGRLARFGGDFLWQVRLEDEGRRQVNYKLPSLDPLFTTEERRYTTTAWDSKIVGRPGTATLGLSGFGGIYVRLSGAAPRASGGIVVYRPEHWVFEGTDLYYADQFGASPSHIVSFEVDGLDYTFRDGLPYPTGKDGARESLEILVMTPTAGCYEQNRHGGAVLAPRGEIDAVLGELDIFWGFEASDMDRGSAMIVVFDRGAGTVFNAGLSEWVSGLIHADFYVEQVTRNVLNRFLCSAD